MNYSFGTTPMFASAILKASRVTAGIRYLILITAWTRFATLGVAQTLPYFPTSIFIPELKPPPAQDNATINVAYIFSPQEDWVNLLALNFSGNLRASSLPLQTLSSNVPFLDTKSTAFIPSLADNGSLIVYAGDCSSPASSEIWTFNPSPNDDASSSWMKASTTLATKEDNVQVGPSFLGTGFSFSNTLAPVLSPANTYVYGGMCPNETAIGTSSQQKAAYSNQMIKIAPSATDAGEFTVGPISSDGPPVPEAGFTFTGLSASVSNRTGIITQQINYVLLGGHTETAFINMSTVAIWSLPEESWNFVSDINVGSPGSNTELAVKSNDIDKIDSRSGHTAVLSEDGTSLIVLGGWVGDLTQAASPQLAILNIGTSYGGNGEWHWSVPDVQPPGPGLYGHGAALLPGNVMMVYGGYNISSSVTTKRQASSSSNLPMFLNLTSMSWSNDYTNPGFSGTDADGSSSDGDSDVGTRLGIGLGVGLGIVAIIIAILLFLLYRRRKRHRRTIRDSAIRALAQDTSRFLPHDDEMMEQDHSGGVWYTGGPDPYLRGNRSLGYQSLRTSMDNGPQPSWYGGMPPARKPLLRRNTYDPPSGVIHPIIEADEDAALHDGDITSEPVSPIRDMNIDGRRDSDPFLTPTTQENPISFPPSNRASITPSPEERHLTTDPEVQDWMTDVEAMDALLNSRTAARMSGASGQNSPTRRGPDDARTESNISETNRNNLGVSRSESVRSVLRSGLGIAAAALGASSSSSPPAQPPPPPPPPTNDETRGGSSGSSNSAPSYNTARSSFAALQAEGPALLMGKGRDECEAPGSPSKNKPRRNWLGSLRRVFNGGVSPPETPDREKQLDESFADANDYDMPRSGLSEIAAGGLLRRKSGRGDWEGMEERYDRKGKGRVTTGGSSYQERGTAVEDDDDEEWDIEKAVEKRLVQVMFTVPREPLRVVNAEPDVESGKDVAIAVTNQEAGREQDITESHQAPVAVIEEHDLGTPLPSPIEDDEIRLAEAREAEQQILREVGEELDAEWKRSATERGRQPPTTPTHRTPVLLREEGVRLLGAAEPGSESRKRKPSRSPVVDPDGDVFSAQTVRLERPRTKVLAMVESLESLHNKSREGSPAVSPTR
ncbi:hypothetical protein F4811DRAFT_167761 [Daldinia bambusicola]|nr:hypothetical protein F4811DRAFT_167761 [Daldinia bambusicola]